MKVFFDTVGCKLNQAEIEQMAIQFRASGHRIVESAMDADLVIINSCTVTAAAASDSRQKVRQAAHAGVKKIVFTGCLATVDPALDKLMNGDIQVIPNPEKERIPVFFEAGINEFDLEPLARTPLPGIHKKTRAFIKVQDGCDNFCTFCVTRVARGKAKSVHKDEILKDVLWAEKGGTNEVVLCGVNLGFWGRDQEGGEGITDLIQFLLDKSNIGRIRLSSIEPWDLDQRFFNLWNDPRMCRHLHLPLQSGSAEILRRMARNTTPDRYRNLVNNAKETIPGLAITTDIIVGFPGETDRHFEESMLFIKEMEFAGGHVFKYSAREGTPAARLPDRVHGKVAQERGRSIREIFTNASRNYEQRFSGNELVALWETAKNAKEGETLMHGLTDNYIQVSAYSRKNRINCFDKVRILESRNNAANAVIL